MSDEATNPAPQPQSHPGFFLTLDGPDGAGKTTQAADLVAWLRSDGFDVVACRDPGSTPLGDRLRQIVLDRDTVNLSLRAEMLVYMASRAQLVEEVVRPALASGKIVVSDRFLLANIIYQGYAGGLPIDELWQIGRTATGGLLPDLTLILDVAIDLARARAGGARDRIEDRPELYHQRVREGFLDAARQGAEGKLCPYYPAPITLIDSTAEPRIVFNRIQREVRSVLAFSPRP